MLSMVNLAALPGIGVKAVVCRHEPPQWSEAESGVDYRVVLVRRGRFRRRTAHGVAELDRTLAYVGVPDQEEHFAHPCGNDECTLVNVSRRAWDALAGDGRMRRSTFYVDAALDLAHRRLVAPANGDTAYAFAEQVAGVLGQVVGALVDGPTPSGPSASAADERLAALARQAIDDGLPAARGLLLLAEHLSVSPYRLSRAFTRSLGVSLTRYRNRVRVGRALDRLECGETNLAALAAELGFADQAHLSRTVREHLGHSPVALRRLLQVSRE